MSDSDPDSQLSNRSTSFHFSFSDSAFISFRSVPAVGNCETGKDRSTQGKQWDKKSVPYALNPVSIDIDQFMVF